MVEVTIKYHVADKAGRTFRPIGDIAKDVEREIWESPFFFRSNILSNCG